MFISKGKMRKEVRRNYLIVKIFIVKDWLFIRDFVGFCVIWNDRFGMEKCFEMISGCLWDKVKSWIFVWYYGMVLFLIGNLFILFLY